MTAECDENLSYSKYKNMFGGINLSLQNNTKKNTSFREISVPEMSFFLKSFSPKKFFQPSLVFA